MQSPPKSSELYFGGSLGCLLQRDAEALATQLGGLACLSRDECDAIHAAATISILITLQSKLGRVLLLELNAARVRGELKGETSEARWDDFLAQSEAPDFWDRLAPHYPPMPGMAARLIRSRREAALAFAQRWAADRDELEILLGRPAGALTGLSFGAGDAHNGGHSVVLVTCEGGRVAYKPRSVAVERELRAFIEGLGIETSMRVPKVVEKGTHGWCEFVEHRFAADEHELARFYEGIGHWLAVMRLVGGTDLHAENLIACGPSPVIVDCETLFSPLLPAFPSGFGDATDKAMELISATVLATGLLPRRGQGLGFRGIDMSGVGALPGQQPTQLLPDIVDAGTDMARIGMRRVTIQPSANHPAGKPSLAEFWPQVLGGFEELSARLRALADLRARLKPFEDCRIRVVCRATEVYAEIARMLWHPVSLHGPDKAIARAHALLAEMATNVSLAPSDPAVIAAETGVLAMGDIPYFSTIARDGVLDGPGGTHWLPRANLVEAAWRSWRRSDLAVEKDYVRAALVSAYVNDGWLPDDASFRPAKERAGDLDARRRRQAASIMRRMVATAMHGEDGTATWVAPALGGSGWSVQSLNADLYAGVSGVAVLAGAYLREMRAGRADAVEGVEDLFAGVMRTLDAFDEKRLSDERKGYLMRPASPGSYLGLGSQIWTNLLLTQWGLHDGLVRARSLAEGIPAAAQADQIFDVLSGKAGAIPALIALAQASGDDSHLATARALADDLVTRATRNNGYASWPLPRWPEGVGGYAHGVTGIGWALTRLGRAARDDRYSETARAAFAFEESLYDADEANWIDLRRLDDHKSAAAWCHGSVGIGLARLDLDPALEEGETELILRRAVDATWRMGFGWNHSACHGDVGAWELIDRAIPLGQGPCGLSREALLAEVLTSLEDNGPICGLVRDAFVPGLFPGLGGVAYQLLRAHPESGLPSILVLPT
ncbi:MAG TPA: type 2 lanthipeptide synthetase LanM family protein [Rhizomicrobium sp.]|jgi:type 2 lantibiotic biosynthesis protein LanM